MSSMLSLLLAVKLVRPIFYSNEWYFIPSGCLLIAYNGSFVWWNPVGNGAAYSLPLLYLVKVCSSILQVFHAAKAVQLPQQV